MLNGATEPDAELMRTLGLDKFTAKEHNLNEAQYTAIANDLGMQRDATHGIAAVREQSLKMARGASRERSLLQQRLASDEVVSPATRTVQQYSQPLFVGFGAAEPRSRLERYVRAVQTWIAEKWLARAPGGMSLPSSPVNVALKPATVHPRMHVSPLKERDVSANTDAHPSTDRGKRYRRLAALIHTTARRFWLRMTRLKESTGIDLANAKKTVSPHGVKPIATGDPLVDGRSNRSS